MILLYMSVWYIHRHPILVQSLPESINYVKITSKRVVFITEYSSKAIYSITQEKDQEIQKKTLARKQCDLVETVSIKEKPGGKEEKAKNT